LNPQDDLIKSVDSVYIAIGNENLETAIDTALSFLSLSIYEFVLDMKVASGQSRQFNGVLKDSRGRSLFTAFSAADIYDDQITEVSLEFNQAGFASGRSIIVLRDHFPWDSPGLDSALIQLGLHRGTGDNAYQIYPSSEMPYIEMRPGIDLVIISNDQPQEFYDNYAVSQERFETFARNGGTLLWCACDLGWNYGSIWSSGLSLPGNVELEYSLDRVNARAPDDFALSRGLPDTLYGNYASQEAFTFLPYGANIYLYNSDGAPTLIGFRLGSGWVIISAQPLEYNFDRRGSYSMGIMLPRILRFLTGSPDNETQTGFHIEPENNPDIAGERSSTFLSALKRDNQL